MYEQLFQRAIRSAARLLFAAALLMLAWGAAYCGYVLSNVGMTGPSLSDQAGWIGAMLSVFAIAFSPAAKLFFGAVIIHYIEDWMRQRQ